MAVPCPRDSVGDAEVGLEEVVRRADRLLGPEPGDLPKYEAEPEVSAVNGGADGKTRPHGRVIIVSIPQNSEAERSGLVQPVPLHDRPHGFPSHVRLVAAQAIEPGRDVAREYADSI